MDPLAIAKIANIGIEAFFKFSTRPKGAVSKAEIKTYVWDSLETMEAIGKLTIKNQKTCAKAVTSIVDGVFTLLGATELS